MYKKHVREGPATWEGTRLTARLWKEEFGCDQREFEALRYGVWDPPDRYTPPFQKLPRGLPNWSPLELQFAAETIEKRLKTGVWEEMSPQEALRSKYLSTEFITETSPGKLRSVADLNHLSSFWNRRPKKISTLESFAISLKRNDDMISFDLKGGYHHFRIHPDLRKCFVVKFGRRYFRYIALPFGWRHSEYWFIRLTIRLWKFLRDKYRYRILDYIDDVLVCPHGKRSRKSHCRRATKVITRLLIRYGLHLHPTKGCMGDGVKMLDHLGMTTAEMKFVVPATKVERVRKMAMSIMKKVRANRRQVDRSLLRSFAGVCQSLSLAVPESRFRLKALHSSIASSKTRRATLQSATIKEVLWWKDLGAHLHSRRISPEEPTILGTLHTDASQSAWGGTWSPTKDQPGTPGCYEVRGFWSTKIRDTSHITMKELMSVRYAISEFRLWYKTTNQTQTNGGGLSLYET